MNRIELKFLRHLILSFIFLLSLPSFGQGKVDKKIEENLYETALEHLVFEEFIQAQRTFDQLLKLVTDNPQYYLEAGMSYYNSATGKDKSLGYFQKAVLTSKKDTIPEVFYYLGRAYQYNNEFEDAIKAYEKFKTFLKDNRSGKKLTEEVDEYIKTCQHGTYHLGLASVRTVAALHEHTSDYQKFYTSDSTFIIIENYGKKINSKFDDYAPMPVFNNDVLLMTSRRNVIGEEHKPMFDGQYYENMYVAKFKNGEWQEPVLSDYSTLFGKYLKNTDLHDAIVSITANEDEILVYRYNSIYSTKKLNKNWGPLVTAFPDLAEDDDLESSACISPDGKTLLVVSNKSGGYGNRDIYISEKGTDGNWGELKNLGSTINTKKDEESPYISKDGKYLYFSSTGHSSIGGYDIFISENKNGEWQTPRSLGVPINTAFDELYFRESSDNKYTVYASSRKGGYGGFDLYKISEGFVPKEEISAVQEELSKIAEKTINDTTQLSFEQLLNKEPDWVESDYDTEEDTREMSSMEELLAKAEQFEKGKIDDEAEAALLENPKEESKTEIENQESTTGNEIPNQVNPKVEDPQIIEAKQQVKEEPKQIEAPKKEADDEPALKDSDTDIDIPADMLANIQFGFNSNELSEANKKQLDKLSKYLKENENFVLTVTGHTDDIGDEELNKLIGEKRALMVLNYLVDKGGDPMRINFASKGESEPLVANTSSENRAKNRRAELDVEKNKLYRYIFFAFDSYDVTIESQSTLKMVTKYLKMNPQYKVNLRGFADNTGDVNYNKYLSEQRVKATRAFMIESGISSNQIEVDFYGEERPSMPNTSKDYKRYNRRVEIRVN